MSIQSTQHRRDQAMSALAGQSDPQVLRRMVLDVLRSQGKRRGKKSLRQGREN